MQACNTLGARINSPIDTLLHLPLSRKPQKTKLDFSKSPNSGHLVLRWASAVGSANVWLLFISHRCTKTYGLASRHRTTFIFPYIWLGRCAGMNLWLNNDALFWRANMISLETAFYIWMWSKSIWPWLTLRGCFVHVWVCLGLFMCKHYSINSVQVARESWLLSELWGISWGFHVRDKMKMNCLSVRSG